MKRLERPIGLYILTFADFVGFGVLQVVQFFQETSLAEEKPSLVFVFITLFLGLFTAGSAVWAFFGDNYGRYALLIFVTLNILWLYTDLLFYISDKGLEDTSGVQYTIAVVKGIAGLGVNWWYLMSDEVVAYFNQKT